MNADVLEIHEYNDLRVGETSTLYEMIDLILRILRTIFSNHLWNSLRFRVSNVAQAT